MYYYNADSDLLHEAKRVWYCNFNVKLAKSCGHFSIVEMSTSSSSQSNILSSIYTALYAHPRKSSISQAGL